MEPSRHSVTGQAITRMMLFHTIVSAVIGLSCLVTGLMAGQAHADTHTLPAPTGPVLLEISGNIERTNLGSKAQFDLAMLEVLPSETFTTSTAWDEGEQQFQGVRLDALLEAVGAGSKQFRAEAVDDYVIEFADLDPTAFDIIIAYKQNGDYMNVRSLGPLRIMYDFDRHPELLAQSNLTMAVWQLVRMVVH